MYVVNSITEVSSKEREKLLKEYEKIKKEYEELSDKKNYIYRVTLEKRKLERQARHIDKIAEDRKLLLKEYEARNAKLPKCQ